MLMKPFMYKMGVGSHQGSPLSSFLLVMVMDRLADEFRKESSWTMMFADGIVICSESRRRWRRAEE